ncbi:related to MRPS9 - mitochondrial ribosomal protein, small subunit [Melanopsichium pennsylvanicum]|uniref:Related to MRPS9 - mitochondrial ribosomal protein, small subunit n=2 Tax=Melanopsichium pennsylvanicum TaxID=63383 RepID=A0AAJ5C5C2_9BASI|nr:related to MRPS9-mitochondrial ribosomal protein, small subunit [Melanopsichium pennsylvanicum 4]SNX84585.1 related to MRPS9 - mitochondrial ribosomal protein, small subunit [Melanopsichium pennsylvanicum]
MVMATPAPSTRVLAASLRQLTLNSNAISTTTTTTIAVRLASTSAHTSGSSSSSDAYSRARMPRLPPVAPLPSRVKPTSPAYYTGRPAYIDTLLSLEELTRQTKRLLEFAHLLPPNSGPPAVSSGTSRGNLWVSSVQLEQILGTGLKAAQYRQIISRLGLLARYAGLVSQFEQNPELHSIGLLRANSVVGSSNGDETLLVEKFHNTLERFMNENAKTNNLLAEKDSDKALWDASKKKVDGHGRAYSKGRRKESSAQVWVIRTKDQDDVGQILINNQPLAEYFTRVAEREAVTWPLKLTSTLGSYNVFALARGGGKSGQAGAIAHALANAIVAETGYSLEMEQGLKIKKYVKDILAKDGVLKRDPRMVERKKTGLAKARKAFTWVKR